MGGLICCAFPRTASTYLVESLKVAYPDKEIYHIFHKIEVLRKENNMITIIRKPEDAVASWLTKIDDTDIDGHLDWYNRFLKATLDRFNDIVILEFEEIVSDINIAISKCANFFRLEKPNYVDSNYVVEHIKKELPDRFSLEKNIALIEKIKQSKGYKESFDYYNQVKQLVKKGI